VARYHFKSLKYKPEVMQRSTVIPFLIENIRINIEQKVYEL